MKTSQGQSIKIVAKTCEVDVNDINTERINKELTLLAGKAAGVCYMPDDYMEKGIQNEEKAFARAKQTAESGHHSVYDHGHITFVVKTNKMIAMILNSLGIYATSEKSARYTKMKPETELELQLYEKWKVKIRELILNRYPDIDDDVLSVKLCKQMGVEKSNIVNNGEVALKEDDWINDELGRIKREFKDTLPSAKLAQENARYMISVFTPTTLMYTTSFRQVFLILDYFLKLGINLENAEDSFSKKLYPYVKEFYEELRGVIGEERLKDTKNQHIRFLEAQHIGEITKENKFKKFNDLEERMKPKKNYIGDSYTITYFGSLAMLAQAQRHRTLRYTMCLTEIDDYSFYIPDIVDESGLYDEWIKDIRSIAHCFPQGTMVRITEQGLFEDFVLKCKERLCGRAQLEIMRVTSESLNRFIDESEQLSYSNQKLLENITQLSPKKTLNDHYDRIPSARCQFSDFKCREGCRWGCRGAFERLI